MCSFLLYLLLFITTICFTSYPSIQSQVHQWLNKVRQNPRILIPHIQRQMRKFRGRKMPLAPGFLQSTSEGRPAWQQAINFLRRQGPMHALKRHKGLDLSSRDHCNFLKRVNKVTHTGEYGNRLRERVEKYSLYDHGKIGENIAQEFTNVRRNHGLEIIVSLIIDDGILNRGHRRSLFTKDFKYIGISTQKTDKHYYCVINLSSQNMKLKRRVAGSRRVQRPVRARVNPYGYRGYGRPMANWWYNPFADY